MNKIIFAAFFICCYSCRQTNIVSPVPAVDAFDFTVNLSSPVYASLKSSVTAVETPDCGYRKHGIIIYRHIYEYEMFAWDATCVDNADCIEAGVVRPSSTNATQGKCARCGAMYSLTDGMHTQKKVLLRSYYMRPISNMNGQWRVSNR